MISVTTIHGQFWFLVGVQIMTRLDPRGMSPPGKGLPTRETNKLRGISASQYCKRHHQSKRISNEQKSKSDQKKRVPEIAFTHSTSSNVRSPVLGARKINPMKSALEAGADTIGQISAKLRTDKKERKRKLFRIWASRLGSPLPGGNHPRVLLFIEWEIPTDYDCISPHYAKWGELCITGCN